MPMTLLIGPSFMADCSCLYKSRRVNCPFDIRSLETNNHTNARTHARTHTDRHADHQSKWLCFTSGSAPTMKSIHSRGCSSSDHHNSTEHTSSCHPQNVVCWEYTHYQLNSINHTPICSRRTTLVRLAHNCSSNSSIYLADKPYLGFASGSQILHKENCTAPRVNNCSMNKVLAGAQPTPLYD